MTSKNFCTKLLLCVISFHVVSSEPCLPKTAINIINYDLPCPPPASADDCPPETQTQNVYVINSTPDNQAIDIPITTTSSQSSCVEWPKKSCIKKCCSNTYSQNSYPTYSVSNYGNCGYTSNSYGNILQSLLPSLSQTPWSVYEQCVPQQTDCADNGADGGRITFTTVVDDGTVTVTFERNSDCQPQGYVKKTFVC